MKKLLSWILCVCVCLTGMAGAFAEEAAPADARLVFAADCMQQIKDLAAEKEIKFEGAWDISELDKDAILKAAIISVSPEQVAGVDAMGTLSDLSRMINVFNGDYTEKAAALAIEGTDAAVANGENFVIFAMYEFHILLTLVRSDGTWGSVLLMSDRNVLGQFSEQAVRMMVTQYLPGDFGLEVLEINP